MRGDRPENYFHAGSYVNARRQFRASAVAGNYSETIYHNRHPLTSRENRIISGDFLCADVARMGALDAKKLLIVTSGVHGGEGYAGSAIQSFSIENKILNPLPADMAVVFVHALNPYGMAFMHRANEHNVDLNRNFINWNKPLPAGHPDAAEVQRALLSPESWQWPIPAFMDFVQRKGALHMQTVLTAGTYTMPDGLFYGGAGPEWSHRIWRDIIATHITPRTREVKHIDLHTGLGKRGYGELIVPFHDKSAEFKRARECWGTETVTSPLDGTSTATPPEGPMNFAFNQVSKNVIVTTATLEFGTQKVPDVLHALTMDNWIRANCISDPALLAECGERMREAFCPSDDTWKRMIVDRGVQVLQQAKRSLERS